VGFCTAKNVLIRGEHYEEIFRQGSIRTYFTETEQGLVLKIIFMAINPENSFGMLQIEV